MERIRKMIKNVLEYLEHAAHHYPNKIAIIDDDRKISFQKLEREAKRIASRILETCGNIKNEPVAVYMGKSIDCIVCFLGILYSGNFYCPIDVNSPSERIEKIIGVLQPRGILCKEDTVFKTQIPTIMVNMDANSKVEDIRIPRDTLDIDPVYVLFTSGSTGLPKGVVISHRGVIDYIEWLTNTFEFDENTIFGNQAPFYFDNSILDIYSTLKNASTMVIIPENKFVFPNLLLDYINKEKINTIFWVPSALIAVANSGVLEKKKLTSLKKVLFCGEVMPNKQLNIWRRCNPQCIYANLYGPTEITDVCSYYIVEREFKDDEPLPIGKACENTGIMVLNDKNALVDTEEIGELCVRGCCLAMGYYGDWVKTSQAFEQNPLNDKYREFIYRTGDLVKYNSVGEIIYIGRKDFQIKHQGHRIELGEIESAVLSMEKIRQCCTIYDEINKKIILIYTTKEVILEKEIYAYLKQKLPRYMLPSKMLSVDEIPLNANGKTDRTKLKQIFETIEK